MAQETALQVIELQQLPIIVEDVYKRQGWICTPDENKKVLRGGRFP